MKIQRLICTTCSGPLEVPVKAKFVTCTFCDTALRIEWNGNAAYTEVLDQIDSRTERIARDVAHIKDELQRMDERWDVQRRDFVSVDEDGSEHAPSPPGIAVLAHVVIFGSALFLIAGIMSWAGSVAIGPIVILAFLAIVGLAIVTVIKSTGGNRRYARSKQDYIDKRRNVVLHAHDRGLPLDDGVNLNLVMEHDEE